ncbi:protein YgfX [Deefgea rivuli]|uniref:protein YgfX n=1 Tax=Deefgea rivuli TaxID=400948 RepID=UPI00048389ED|nr:protein YgfX [Deefgea rivuli]
MLPPVLQINPASSWRRGFLLFIFSSAIIAILVCIATQAIWIQLFGVILLIPLWFYWRSIEPIAVLVAQASGEVELLDLQGNVELMRLLPTSVVTSGLMVLHLQGENRRRVLVLWPDSAPAETLRQWRVWLRWVWPALQADEPE